MSLNTLLFCLFALFTIVYCVCEGEVCDPCPDGYGRREGDAANCCYSCDIDCKVETSTSPCPVIDSCAEGEYLDRPYGCCDMCLECDYSACPVVECSDAFLPEGECCMACPQEDPCVDFNYEDCPPADCSDAYIPEGECCLVCPGEDPCVDFNTDDCPVVNCSDAYIPEGKCCRECPQDDPCVDFNYEDCPPADCSDAYIPEGECCKACPGDDPCVDFNYEDCPPIDCSDAYLPEGECCRVCPGDDPCVDFNYEDCPPADCSDAYIPEGECCKACPGDDPCVDFNYEDCPPADCSDAYIPEGECCKACPGDNPCDDFNYEDCPPADCSDAYIPEGKCCKECPQEDPCEDFDPNECNSDATSVNHEDDPCWFSYTSTNRPCCLTWVEIECPRPECNEPVQYEGKCCKECPPVTDCDNIICGEVRCENGIEPEIVGDDCCPTCPKVDKCEDFDYSQCKTRECYAGEKVIMKDCCPVCVRPCDSVDCPEYTCADGELDFPSHDQCCEDSCVPTTCSNVLCQKPECSKEEERYIPAGECCPKCRKIEDRDCEQDIECGDIRCEQNHVEVIPFGQCCPVCRLRTGYEISSGNITIVVDEEKLKEIIFELFGDEISIADFEIIPVGDGKFFIQFASEEQEIEFKSLISSSSNYDSIIVEEIVDEGLDTDASSGALVFVLVVAFAAMF